MAPELPPEGAYFVREITWPCLLCSQEFRRISAYRTHLVNHHHIAHLFLDGLIRLTEEERDQAQEN